MKHTSHKVICTIPIAAGSASDKALRALIGRQWPATIDSVKYDNVGALPTYTDPCATFWTFFEIAPHLGTGFA